MRFYRALLRLYPASFRADYAPELERAFHEQTRDRGSFSATMSAIADVVPNAAAAHWELLRQDLAYSARSLRRTPGFALTAILVVALGVGANTAAFSLADFIFLKPFAYPESDRLVRLWQADIISKWNNNELSPGNFRDWKRQQHSFSGMGAFTFRSSNLVSASDPRRIEMVRVTSEVLPVLGVQPIVGRLFTPDDTLTGQAVVLSFGLWQSQFGGDPGVVGTTVRLDGVPHTVAGVMPRAFQFPTPGIEAWAPIVWSQQDFEDRTDTYITGVARLRPGVTREQANRDLDVIATNLERQFPEANYHVRAGVFGLREQISERSRLLIVALCGASLCILLLACANLASLFLARGAHRGRELAVRAALGAGRERLMRQLVTESLGLALVGGALGVVVATTSVRLLAQLVPGSLPVAESFPELDWRVLALAAAFVLITGVAFGLAPAIRAGKSDALDAMRNGSRAGGGRTQRVRSALVVVEVAASVILLILSGLMIRAVWRIQAIDPGFVADNVLTLRTALPFPKYDSTAQRVLYYERVLQEVRAIPGVHSAAYVTGLPMRMGGGIWSVTIPGRDVVRDGSNSVSLRFATSQYFATLGIPLRRGRDLAATDIHDGQRVAVVSESFARKHWPGEEPIGKRFILAAQERSVVGVVGDVKVRGLERSSEPQVYLPPTQPDSVSVVNYSPKELVVRTEGSPTALLPRIREIVKSVDPDQPISHVRLLSDILGDQTAPRVTQLRLLGALSAIALLIAGLGIHGLLTFTVSNRSQELGVRRALGAQLGGIVGLVLREGLVLAATGTVIGLAVAYGAARGMGALLAGVRPEDPVTLSIAAVLCFVTALVGCVGPALRAAHVDPLTALRAE